MDVLLSVELKILVLGVLVFAASVLLTGIVRRFALASGLTDVPNPRSSHTRITARGGGLAVVLTTTAGVIVLALAGVVSKPLFMTVAIGGGTIALVGYLDDRRQVRPVLRFIVHACAALWALGWLGGLPPLLFGDHLIKLGAAGYVLGALGIVWVLNLFNFMDGIDGIAATEAIFITCAAVLAGLIRGWPAEVPAASWVLAFASAGFLCWNWPPAKVFLGDVGSGYLGYIIAVLALTSAQTDPVALWVWLILGGAFFVDATVTLVRRWLRRDRVFEPHRSHAYQWLTRRWGSHGKVTGTVFAVNLVWLLPWSMLAANLPYYASVAVIGALVPLAVLAVLLGSGRREHNPARQ
jgi:Fuc2NAc and GlcNAc transferase